MHLQMDEIRQEIQDATSDYLVNIPTPNINIINTSYETINYIKELFQAHHYCTITQTTPISHISSTSSR